VDLRRLGPGLVLGLIAVVTACQAPGPFGAPGGQGAGGADPRLAAADAKLYSGDYDGAETAYRSLVQAEVPDAAAHYSTLLAYEVRLPEAVQQARDGVATHADSDSLARLSHALETSVDLQAALDAGARAVAIHPVDPLAHAYYGEALMDARRLSEGESQLSQVPATTTDPYARAETERDLGMLAGYQQDNAAELNHYSIALKEQPGFPERSFDLAAYYLTHQQQAPGEQLLNGVQSAEPRGYRALVGAASTAFAAEDLPLAAKLFASAHDVRPPGSEAAIGAAELSVLVGHDARGAHDLLARTLRADPTLSDVYQFARELDLLVLNVDPNTDLTSVVPRPPTDLDATRRAVLDSVNRSRALLGLKPLAADGALADAAEAHAYYVLFNLTDQAIAGTGIHTQSRSDQGFVGVSNLDRARHFGFRGDAADEVIDHLPDGVADVRAWIDSVYHRYALLSPQASSAGYGEARVGLVSMNVLEIGLDPPGRADPLVYPVPNQTAVPPRFLDNEVPDPLPVGAPQPAGYPITLAIGDGQTLRVDAGRLVSPSGIEVPSYSITPGQGDDSSSEWGLVPRSPLQPGGRYRVEVAGAIDGAPFTKQWSFTVARGE
jgi:uncharacterized protein YkwD